MGAEKSFENKVKRWLETRGIYPLGTAQTDITTAPIGYYEKRWGGGRYVKSGLPDMHIVCNGISLDVELKADNGKPSELQKHNLIQINTSGSIAMVLYPKGFEKFTSIMEGVIKCNSVIPVLSALKSANTDSTCDIMNSWTRLEPMRPRMTR